MTGTKLLKRILWVLAGTFAFLLFIALAQSNATPIHPDLKKMLARPPETTQFPLARAGWDGAEGSEASNVPPNATLERIGPAASARVARASLKAAAIPDYRAVAGILLVILLLRRIRAQRRLRAVHNVETRPVTPDLPRAA